jgi:hypothetical protein
LEKRPAATRLSTVLTRSEIQEPQARWITPLIGL